MRYKFCVVFVLFSAFLYFCVLKRSSSKSPMQLYISSAYLLENDGDKNTVRLIAMGPQQEFHRPIKCQNQNKDVVDAQFIPEIEYPKCRALNCNNCNKLTVANPPHCKWTNYLIDCKFDSPATNLQFVDFESAEIPVRKPAVQEHDLVVCFGRMFLFENWRIALMAIELYRAHGVSMFSIPIISVIDELYDILKAYEQAGIISLTNGVILPSISNDSNPNHETEFFNQVISNTECLYEFSRSKFLIFADFDDVLIPRNHFNIYHELLNIQISNPLASSFEFWRDSNTMIFFDKKVENFNLDRSIQHIQLTDYKSSPGKTALIPSRIKNGFIHRPLDTDLNDGFTHIKMNETDALFLHLETTFYPLTERSKKEYVNKIKYPSLQQRLDRILNTSEGVRQSFNNLPIEDTYFHAMSNCHREIAEKFRSNVKFCPNALNCQIDQTMTFPKCARLQLEYTTAEMHNLIVHQPIESRIITGENCQI